jgi:DNA-binding CsgD family transcriptional regulator
MKRALFKQINRFNNELVELDNKLYQIKLSLIPFSDMDKSIKSKLVNLYASDTKAMNGLMLMKVPFSDHIEQFGICRFGGLDNQIDIEGNNMNPEWFDCGRRGNCPGEGLVCKSIKTENGLIAPRLIQYMQLLCLGLTDKEIANHMNVAISTAKTFKARCMDATECRTKSELTAWAKDRGIA